MSKRIVRNHYSVWAVLIAFSVLLSACQSSSGAKTSEPLSKAPSTSVQSEKSSTGNPQTSTVQIQDTHSDEVSQSKTTISSSQTNPGSSPAMAAETNQFGPKTAALTDSIPLLEMDKDLWTAKLSVYKEGHELWEQEKPLELYSPEDQTIRQYKEIKPVKAATSNPLLVALMESKWSDSAVIAQLGSNYDVLDYYQVFSDKGILIKDLNGKIDHVVFRGNYKGQIINKVDMRSKRDDIISALGDPQFTDPQYNVIGYKTENFYIFFTGKEKLSEAAVYRRDSQYDGSVLQRAISGFSKDQDGLNFFHTIRAVWGDYDWEVGASAQSYIGYNSKGLYASFNEANPNAADGLKIFIYNNYIGSISEDLALPGKVSGLADYSNVSVVFRLDKDSVFEHELYRLESSRRIRAEALPSPAGTMKVYSGATFEFGGFLKLMDGAGKILETELDLGCKISDLQWMDDQCLIYVGKEIDGYVDRLPPEEHYGVHILDTKNMRLYRVKLAATQEQEMGIDIVSVSKHKITFQDASGKTQTLRFQYDKKSNVQLFKE